ncbi:beta-glucanase (GH16 family) [Neolewinella xylanilytica]|uniref:Beta-glucanase (GH16 family) n=1 Tax=Neolewinella xylanilytica TaxID=1514080 RepID=A0A2S6IB54_9BACT|nr:glycoside hydrolase family 16 protein [Neolewinella xylanilytica]PPK88741.1 beta-glucanase (GH16 family) [Neolewinella xylanilytica]
MVLLRFVAPFIGLLMIGCASGTPALNGPPPDDAAVPEGYALVWSEEFDRGTRPDTSVWGYERGFVRNEEDQWYQEDNVRIEAGYLIIEGRRESMPNPSYVSGSDSWRTSRPTVEYTSSSINTRGKYDWQYGRFELRAKIPVGEGIWPAWWTLGVEGPWPANGEIDIMEYYDGVILANVASRDDDGGARWSSVRVPLDSLGGQAWADAFHVWRMDWDQDAIALYVDDSLLNRTLISEMPNAGDYDFEPFHQPHYMLLNLALGGRNGGPLDNTPLPARYLVDYVRVYQRR